MHHQRRRLALLYDAGNPKSLDDTQRPGVFQLPPSGVIRRIPLAMRCWAFIQRRGRWIHGSRQCGYNLLALQSRPALSSAPRATKRKRRKENIKKGKKVQVPPLWKYLRYPRYLRKFFRTASAPEEAKPGRSEGESSKRHQRNHGTRSDAKQSDVSGRNFLLGAIPKIHPEPIDNRGSANYMQDLIFALFALSAAIAGSRLPNQTMKEGRGADQSL